MSNTVALFALVAACPALTIAAESALEIARKAQDRTRAQSERYAGTLTVTDSKGKTTEKRWTYDRIGSHGNSKVVLRFTAPAEVKGVALLVVNHPDRSSDQWMWTPALERDRRVAMQDRSTRFFGTDFSFEDLEERDVNQFDYELLAEEVRQGASCWKLRSRPKQSKSSQYTSSLLWIRQSDYALLDIENYKGDQPVRRIGYRDIETVQGILTARRIEVHDVARNSRTVLKLQELKYNVPAREEDFSLPALRRG